MASVGIGMLASWHTRPVAHRARGVVLGVGLPFAFAAMAKLIVDAVRPTETGSPRDEHRHADDRRRRRRPDGRCDPHGQHDPGADVPAESAYTAAFWAACCRRRTRRPRRPGRHGAGPAPGVASRWRWPSDRLPTRWRRRSSVSTERLCARVRGGRRLERTPADLDGSGLALARRGRVARCAPECSPTASGRATRPRRGRCNALEAAGLAERVPDPAGRPRRPRRRNGGRQGACRRGPRPAAAAARLELRPAGHGRARAARRSPPAAHRRARGRVALGATSPASDS